MTYVNKRYPLVKESHPSSYIGYPFITLLVYGEEKVLTIIDNHNKHTINAFVLDQCEIEGIDESLVIKIVSQWYYNDQSYPISIEFAKYPELNINKIYKSFNINYVKRIIGPLPEYNMEFTKKIKRKKRKISDTNMEVIFNPFVWQN
jgi:hypothetical protein